MPFNLNTYWVLMALLGTSWSNNVPFSQTYTKTFSFYAVKQIVSFIGVCFIYFDRCFYVTFSLGGGALPPPRNLPEYP